MQSAEGTPERLALRPPRARRRRPRAAGGAGQRWRWGGAPGPCGVEPPRLLWARERSRGGLFFWFVQGAAGAAFPTSRRSGAEAEPRARPGGGCGRDGPGSAVPAEESGRSASRSHLLPGLARLSLPSRSSFISSARNSEASLACQASCEVPSGWKINDAFPV